MLLLALATSVGPSPALAATGGAHLPGGAESAVPAPSSGPLVGPGAAEGPPATAPAADSANQAEPVALVPSPPAMPVLASAARKVDDPIPTDVAALSTPSMIAAIDGHVVIVRQRMSRSELVDLAEPSSPRVLLSSTRPFGMPQAGRDAAGRAVIVASPCAGADAVVRLGQAPRCPLRAIDALTGASRPLPGTTGALAGDLAGERLVFTRRSPSAGVRLYESAAGAAAQVVELPQLGKPGDGWTAASGKPAPGSLRAGGFDVDPAGRLAIVLEYVAAKPEFSSGLWVRQATLGWHRLTTIGTTFAGLGTRHVMGPNLDATGAIAYVEGVIEAPSFVGRWDDDGTATFRLSVRRSIGRSTILRDTAFDRGRLLFVDWLPGAPCGSEGALACGLRALGPVLSSS